MMSAPAPAIPFADMPPDAQALLRSIVAHCLRKQDLPAADRHIDAAIGDIELGLARICEDAGRFWLEAV